MMGGAVFQTQGSVNQPAQPQPAKKPAPQQLSSDNLPGITVRLRFKLSKAEFARLFGRNETLIYPLLSRYGFQGSWVKDSDYIKTFEQRDLQVGQVVFPLAPSGRRKPSTRERGPPSIDERGRAGPAVPDNECRRRIQHARECLFAARPAVLLAPPILALRGQERVNTFLVNSAPIGGAMQATGVTVSARNAMLSNEPVRKVDRIDPPNMRRGEPDSAVPKSSPTNNPDFSDVGRAVGTATPGTTSVGRSRNQYPPFEALPPAQAPTAQAQAVRLSCQIGEPIRADRVFMAPWIGRIRNANKTARSQSTSEGWLQAEGPFWTAFQTGFPSDFALIGRGHTITRELARRWGWSDRTIGQTLVHHHIDNGNLVVAVPEGLHESLSGDTLATVRIEGSP